LFLLNHFHQFPDIAMAHLAQADHYLHLHQFVLVCLSSPFFALVRLYSPLFVFVRPYSSLSNLDIMQPFIPTALASSPFLVFLPDKVPELIVTYYRDPSRSENKGGVALAPEYISCSC
jgi:hypothetical protein